MKHRTFLALMIGALATSLFGSESSWAISRGGVVSASSPLYKSTVFIAARDQNGEDSQCTGVLLGSNVVLTAAHCLEAKMRVVFYGEPGAEPKVHPVINRFPHKTEDLAILVFGNGPHPAEYEPAEILGNDPYYVHAALFNRVVDLAIGSTIIVNGYGKTEEQESELGQLRATDSEYIGQASVGGMISHAGGSGICPGDSGGPGYVIRGGKLYVWGIAKAISTDFSVFYPCGSFGFYTDITEPRVHLWVTKVLNALSQGGQ